MKHPAPYRVKPSFVIFDIRTLYRSGLRATVGVKGFNILVCCFKTEKNRLGSRYD